MKKRTMTLWLLAAACSFAQDQTVPQLLHIEWSRGPNLPQGLQDSDGGIIDDHLIMIGGFCSGGLNQDNRHKPGRYPRGFLKSTWALNLKSKGAAWKQLPDFPGAARQGLSAAKLGNSLYIWGGFSYTKPYCYTDGWKLERKNNKWDWRRLPAFPHAINSVAFAVIGTRIFAFGGSDYNAEAFFTENDRGGNVPRLGARLYLYDTAMPMPKWQQLPQCPGTPRWVHTMTPHQGKLYVIGGATGSHSENGVNYGYCSIVDNWCFDTKSLKWSRLPDSPISSGNFPRSTNNLFKGRYIILPGGHQYGHVLGPDGKVRKAFGKASRKNPKSGLHNDVFVFDLLKKRFGRADYLPIDNNLPQTVVRGNRLFLLGGETGGGMVLGEYYGHHPDLFLIGKIREN